MKIQIEETHWKNQIFWNFIGCFEYFFFHLSIKRTSSASEFKKKGKKFILVYLVIFWIFAVTTSMFGKKRWCRFERKTQEVDKWKSWSAWGLHCQSIKMRFVSFYFLLSFSFDTLRSWYLLSSYTKWKVNPPHDYKCSSVFLKLEQTFEYDSGGPFLHFASAYNFDYEKLSTVCGKIEAKKKNKVNINQHFHPIKICAKRINCN